MTAIFDYTFLSERYKIKLTKKNNISKITIKK